MEKGTGSVDGAVRPLIVIGSSAGGIDALSMLLETLPDGIAAPIVVVQHLDPRRKSRLAEILSRHTRIPVKVVEQSVKLEPGVVLIVPPNRQVDVTDHTLVLHEDGNEVRPTPSIDAMFASAAQSFGEGTIAVILTGTGTDGSVGAKEVKAAGGTVVVQNPETASFPGMPGAIAPSTVDIVAELPAIGPLLNDIVSGAYTPSQPDEDRSLRIFLEQLKERSGIDFSAYKRATILRRLQRRMVATGTQRLRDYIRYVQAHPEEYQRLTSSFLIKVTEFFRDADLFQTLRDEVIPKLIERARNNENELRIWSAGCATGEEAYSLAILVAEALGEELDQFNVRIFSTDVDPEAIAFARRGRYPPSALDSVPEGVRDRHFTREGDQYEVKKNIRMLTVFGQHDLGQRAPFPRVDLTLCRNVLIYFTTDLQRRALQLFAFSLRDGGYLVLGKAESTTPLPEYFVLEQPRLKIYRRQGERVLIPPARIKDTQSILPIRSVTGQRASGLSGLQTSIGRSTNRTVAADRAESVMLRLPVGVILVDRRYDIQLINASARRLLEIHGPAIGDDFVHLLQPQIASQVRSQLDAGFRGEQTTRDYELPSPSIPEPVLRALRVSVERSQADVDEPESVLVLVVDMSDSLRARRAMESALNETRAEHDRVMEQARALESRNSELSTANEALASANAELRSTNEELLVANEEVQAATEEVETLNEELQATNEELETLNEELQATVEELNTTNEDLEARSAELQVSADELEQARSRMENETRRLQLVLDSLPDAVVAVGADGSVTLTNEVYRSLMADGASLKDEHGNPLEGSEMPIARAARGEEFSMRLVAPNGKPLVAESRVTRTGAESVSIVRFRPE